MNHEHTIIYGGYSTSISFLIDNLNDALITIFSLLRQLYDKNIEYIASITKSVDSIIK